MTGKWQLPSIGAKFLKLQKAFQQFDTDGNGVIDRKELAGALKVLGADITDEQVGGSLRACERASVRVRACAAAPPAGAYQPVVRCCGA